MNSSELNNAKDISHNFSVNWFPGHMKKTTDLIKRIAKSVNIAIEVLDARIPLSSRNPLIVSTTENLPRIIVLTKSDLAHPNTTNAWLAYFKKQHYGVIAADLTENKTQKKLTSNLTHILKNILVPQLPPQNPRVPTTGNKNKFIPQLYLALICGIPNAGKSTLINVLAQEKKVKVGNRPGITMDKQLIKISNNYKDKSFSWALIDTPGLLKHKLSENESINLSVCKVVKETIYDPIDLAVAFLERYMFNTKNPLQVFLAKNIFNFYGLLKEDFISTKKKSSAEKEIEVLFLEALALKRNLLEKNGKPNVRIAATTLLQDFQLGKLGRYSLESPPKN